MNEEQIFAEAIQLPVEQREVFLQTACGDDVGLLRRVERLLAAHEAEDSLLEVAATMDSTTDAVAAGKHPLIGNYKLLHKLGEGGFGVVYMAEQMRPVRRKVALKIVKAERMGDAVATVARFEAERQALAMMDHPNIATVFDGGSIPAGSSLLDEALGAVERPFFVMELVNGVPITEYCDKNNLSTRERLKLFVSVCLAVQHAHQKGVIHRDLKPSNILVTLHDGVPVVKIIDFGVAKAINQQLTDKTLYTVLGDMIGTPLYMSPEQAERSGLDIDTRSDIYSLGVLLYELLTGTTPLTAKELKEAGILQIQRCIVESEPPKPSTRLSNSGDELTVIAKHRSVSADRLHKELQGDLDWIVMKALDKDRQRRYDAAKDFAIDVQHYLNDEAILARPPSTLYLLSKFARKHKAVTSVAASLLVGFVGTASGLCGTIHSLHVEKVSHQLVVASQEQLQETNTQLSTSNYALAIESAFRAWEMGSLDRLEELLEKCKQVGDSRDLLGFEYRLLKHQFEENFPETTFELEKPAFDVVFSPSGAYLVAALQNGDLCLLNRLTNKVTILSTPVADPRNRTTCLQFVAEDRFIQCGVVNKNGGGKSGLLVYWNVNTVETTAENETPIEVDFATQSIVRETEDSFLVSNAARTRRILADGSLVPDFEINGVNPLIAAGKIYTRNQFGTGNVPQQIWCTDAETGESKVIPTGTQPIAYRVTADGSRFIASDSSGTWTQEIIDGELLDRRQYVTWRRSGGSVPVLNDTCLAYAGLDDNAIRIVTFDTGAELARLLHSKRISALATHDDGQLIASSGKDNTVKVWNLQDHRHAIQGGYPMYWAPFAFSTQAQVIAFADKPDQVVLTGADSTTMKLFKIPANAGEHVAVKDVSLSRNAEMLAVGTRQGQCYLWDVESGEEIPLPVQGTYVRFSPSGNALAIGSPEATYLLQLSNRRPVSGPHLDRPQREKLGASGFLRFSNDESLIVTGHRDATYLQIWDVENDQSREIKVEEGVLNCCISPDNKLLAVADSSDTVQLFDITTGDFVKALPGNGYWLTSAAFSPDGRTIAAASPNGEIKFWRMPTFEDAGSMTMDEGVRNIEFSEDGNRLYWASMGGNFGILQATPVEDRQH